jgi:hypothetical protein
MTSAPDVIRHPHSHHDHAAHGHAHPSLPPLRAKTLLRLSALDRVAIAGLFVAAIWLSVGWAAGWFGVPS